MAEVNEKNLKIAEEVLRRRKEFIKSKSLEVFKVLNQALYGPNAFSERESKDYFDKTFEEFDIKREFQECVEELSPRFIRDFHEEHCDGCFQFNLLGTWISITHSEAEQVLQLQGEEYQNFMDHLYMQKLCEKLKI